MITPELLGYIRGEMSKGRTRAEINGALLAGGGWSEDDLSEAFKEIIPLQGNVSFNKEEPKPSFGSTSTPISIVPPLSSFKPTASATPASSVPTLQKTQPTQQPIQPANPIQPVQTTQPIQSIIQPKSSSFSAPVYSPISAKIGSPSLDPSPSMKQTVLPTPPPVPSHSLPVMKILIILIILAVLGFVFWYFRTPLIDFSNSVMEKVL